MTDDDRELVMGDVYALRGWDLDQRKGELRSPLYRIGTWQDGLNVCQCPVWDKDVKTDTLIARLATFVSLQHAIQELGAAISAMHESKTKDEILAELRTEHFSKCSCGFYATYEKTPARAQGRTLGIIKCEGKVEVGPRGLRAEKATPVALALPKITRKTTTYTSITRFRKAKLYERIFTVIWWITVVGCGLLNGLRLGHHVNHSLLVWIPLGLLFTAAYIALWTLIQTGMLFSSNGTLSRKRLCNKVQKKYPSVHIYDDVDTMISAYPLGLLEDKVKHDD